ncbi:CYSEP [Symbiodinium pilosum]|uniref:CYSEP protein n=1 Tax=Symbiodinium pilosum TaxID=2952 RepID=A0A812LQ31_SYMPI|nr:CYSEP [Symbiodinium pilosum]
MLPTMGGTSEVPTDRFAAKTLKFTPPSWLFNGTWDWLVEFDGDISLNMVGLRPLVDKYSAKSLVLLKWYWRDCQPWDCFMWECEDMLQNRKEYVETSYDRVVKWKERMQKLHDDPAHPFVPADYYELSVMFRNVAHERAGEVEDTFRQVLQQCRTIQRDQFLMPFFLWNSSLEQDVATIPIATLYSDLHYCRVDTRRARVQTEIR